MSNMVDVENCTCIGTLGGYGTTSCNRLLGVTGQLKIICHMSNKIDVENCKSIYWHIGRLLALPAVMETSKNPRNSSIILL